MNENYSEAAVFRLAVDLFAITPADRRDFISEAVDDNHQQNLEAKLAMNPPLRERLQEARVAVPAIIRIVQHLLLEVRKYMGAPVEGERGFRKVASQGEGMRLHALNFADAAKAGKSFEHRSEDGVVKAHLQIGNGEITKLDLEVSSPAETLQSWEIVVLRRDENDHQVLLSSPVEFHSGGSAHRSFATVNLPWNDTTESRRKWDEEVIEIRFRLRLPEYPPA